jgi:hypothetical protein
VEHDHNVLPIRPFFDFRQEDPGQMSVGYIANGIVFADHNCQMMGKARGQERQKKNE